MTTEKTLGEKRIRPSYRTLTTAEKETIESVKSKVSELITMLDSIQIEGREPGRLKSLALTNFEQGSLWAIKYLTS